MQAKTGPLQLLPTSLQSLRLINVNDFNTTEQLDCQHVTALQDLCLFDEFEGARLRVGLSAFALPAALTRLEVDILERHEFLPHLDIVQNLRVLKLMSAKLEWLQKYCARGKPAHP